MDAADALMTRTTAFVECVLCESEQEFVNTIECVTTNAFYYQFQMNLRKFFIVKFDG